MEILAKDRDRQTEIERQGTRVQERQCFPNLWPQNLISGNPRRRCIDCTGQSEFWVSMQFFLFFLRTNLKSPFVKVYQSSSHYRKFIQTV